MKPIIKMATAVAVTAFSLGTMTTAAQASTPLGTSHVSSVTTSAAAYLAGGCQAAKSNYGNIKAYYYTQGKYDYFNRINWYLGGPGLRNKSNVRLRIRLERRGLPDKTIWSHKSRGQCAARRGRVVGPQHPGQAERQGPRRLQLRLRPQRLRPPLR